MKVVGLDIGISCQVTQALKVVSYIRSSGSSYITYASQTKLK